MTARVRRLMVIGAAGTFRRARLLARSVVQCCYGSQRPGGYNGEKRHAEGQHSTSLRGEAIEAGAQACRRRSRHEASPRREGRRQPNSSAPSNRVPAGARMPIVPRYVLRVQSMKPSKE